MSVPAAAAAAAVAPSTGRRATGTVLAASSVDVDKDGDGDGDKVDSLSSKASAAVNMHSSSQSSLHSSRTRDGRCHSGAAKGRTTRSSTLGNLHSTLQSSKDDLTVSAERPSGQHSKRECTNGAETGGAGEGDPAAALPDRVSTGAAPAAVHRRLSAKSRSRNMSRQPVETKVASGGNEEGRFVSEVPAAAASAAALHPVLPSSRHVRRHSVGRVVVHAERPRAAQSTGSLLDGTDVSVLRALALVDVPRKRLSTVEFETSHDSEEEHHHPKPSFGNKQSQPLFRSQSFGAIPGMSLESLERKVSVGQIGRGINILSGSLRSAPFDEIQVGYIEGRGDVGVGALRHPGQLSFVDAKEHASSHSMHPPAFTSSESPAPNLGMLFSRPVTTIPRAPRLSVFPSYKDWEREASRRTVVGSYEQGMYSFSGREPSHAMYSSPHPPLLPFLTGIEKVDGFTHFVMEDEQEEYGLRISNEWRSKAPAKFLSDPDVRRCLRHRFNPKNSRSKRLYYAVIERYGTHFVSEMRFGSKAEMRWSLPTPVSKNAEKRARKLGELQESFIRSFEVWQNAQYPNHVSFQDIVWSMHHGRSTLSDAQEPAGAMKKLLQNIRPSKRAEPVRLSARSRSSRLHASVHELPSSQDTTAMEDASVHAHAGVHHPPAPHVLPKPPKGCVALHKCTSHFRFGENSKQENNSEQRFVELGFKLVELSELFAAVESDNVENDFGRNSAISSHEADMQNAIRSYIADMAPIRDGASARSSVRYALYCNDVQKFISTSEHGQLFANSEQLSDECVFKLKRAPVQDRSSASKSHKLADTAKVAKDGSELYLAAPSPRRRRSHLRKPLSPVKANSGLFAPSTEHHIFGLRNSHFGNKLLSRSMTRTTFQFHRLQVLGPYESFQICGDFLVLGNSMSDPSCLFIDKSGLVGVSDTSITGRRSKIVLVQADPLSLIGLAASTKRPERRDPIYIEDEPDVLFVLQKGENDNLFQGAVPDSCDATVTPRTRRLLEDSSALTNSGISRRPHRSNSTSSMYIRDSIAVPNLEALCHSGALWVRAHVKDGLETEDELVRSSSNVQIFSECLHPLTKQLPSASPSVESIFHFISTIVKVEKLPPEPLIMAFIFVEQATRALKIGLRASNWRRLLLSSLILATKVWEDLSVWNVDFLDLFPRVRVGDLNIMERALLDVLQFEVTVSASDYASCYFLLRGLSAASLPSLGVSDGQLDQKDLPRPLSLEDTGFIDVRTAASVRLSSRSEKANPLEKRLFGLSRTKSNSIGSFDELSVLASASNTQLKATSKASKLAMQPGSLAVLS